MSDTYTFFEFYIPERMMGGIRRWIDHGIEPGDFLQAVIQNDLRGAVGLADDENKRNLPAYVGYFYNEAPRGCWGYEGAIKEWQEKKEREREALRVNAK